MIDKYGFFEQGRKSFLNFQRSFFQNYNSDLLLIDLEKLTFQKIENSIWIETATRKLTNSCKPEADIESWLINGHRLFVSVRRFRPKTGHFLATIYEEKFQTTMYWHTTTMYWYHLHINFFYACIEFLNTYHIPLRYSRYVFVVETLLKWIHFYSNLIWNGQKFQK